MLIKNGQTDVITYFVLRDATTHAPKTDVVITDIDIYYVKEGAEISAKADLTPHAAANDAHSDNKGIHVGKGLYRIDWPDAAFQGGVGKKVYLIVECTGVDTVYLEVELSAPVNTVSLGGTDQTGRDIGASVLLSPGTGTGQISLSSGAVTVGTNNDKTGYGLADSAITSAKFAANAISAAALNADAITAIQNGLAMASELAKVPKSDGAVGWNSTALGQIGTTAENACADAISNYDPPTNAEMEARTLAAASYATATELAKVPKSDGSATWNATALASIQAGAAAALTAYDPPTNTEMEARTLAASNYATASALAAVDTIVDAVKLVTDKLDSMIEEIS